MEKIDVDLFDYQWKNPEVKAGIFIAVKTILNKVNELVEEYNKQQQTESEGSQS